MVSGTEPNRKLQALQLLACATWWLPSCPQKCPQNEKCPSGYAFCSPQCPSITGKGANVMRKVSPGQFPGMRILETQEKGSPRSSSIALAQTFDRPPPWCWVLPRGHPIAGNSGPAFTLCTALAGGLVVVSLQASQAGRWCWAIAQLVPVVSALLVPSTRLQVGRSGKTGTGTGSG